MRGAGQIAELAAIAEPDVAVITNVGPVHVELLGSVEAIAAAKAEILAALPGGRRRGRAGRGGRARAAPRRGAPRLLRFGPGGDVEALERRVVEGVTEALDRDPRRAAGFHFPFAEAHNLTNALAAIAAGVALGAPLAEMADRAANIGFSRFRGERLELGDGIVLVNDCYNANPVSMRAALDHLGSLEGERRIAVLGEMAELGPGAARLPPRGRRPRPRGRGRPAGRGRRAGPRLRPRRAGRRPRGGRRAARRPARARRRVLVKGSRSAGLEAGRRDAAERRSTSEGGV